MATMTKWVLERLAKFFGLRNGQSLDDFEREVQSLDQEAIEAIYWEVECAEAQLS